MTTQPLYESKRTIRLYGTLGTRFGRVHRLAVESTAEAVRALCVLYDGFEAYMLASKDQGVGFAVFLGKRNIGESELHFRANHDIRIAPIIMGAKSGGLFSVVVGAVLIAASFLIPGGALLAAGLFNAGVAMALGGVVQLLSPQPKDPQSKDRPENEPNYAFNGPINTQAQGNCVPVAYGRPWTGSAVVSAGISVGDDVYVPVTEPGDGTNLLLARSPQYLYPMSNASGGIVTDISGHARPDLTLSGAYSVDGSGVTFLTDSGNASASVLSGMGLASKPEQSGFCTVCINDDANTGGYKGLCGLIFNTINGWYQYTVQLKGASPFMTPQAGFNHSAGSGYQATSPTPISVGEIVTLGFQFNDAANTLDVIVNGVVASTVAVPTSVWAASATFYVGSPSGHNGAKMTIRNVIGFDRNWTASELLELDADLRTPTPYNPSGEGDTAWDDAEEVFP